MPSPLNPATDIQATNISAGLLQLAILLQKAEESVPEADRPNNVTVAFDAEDNTASITATLPIAISIDANGQPVIAATDYIP